MISIHVPRGRDDWDQSANLRTRNQFQSTSLVGGTTICRHIPSNVDGAFQSTSLVGGTTAATVIYIESILFQSTSLVGGTTGWLKRVVINPYPISIHVPRGRDDRRKLPASRTAPSFQSTSLVGGTTNNAFAVIIRDEFQSTSLVGGTTRSSVSIWKLSHFNPRPSWEGRRRRSPLIPLLGYFNPRPSWEGRPRIPCRSS